MVGTRSRKRVKKGSQETLSHDEISSHMKDESIVHSKAVGVNETEEEKSLTRKVRPRRSSRPRKSPLKEAASLDHETLEKSPSRSPSQSENVENSQEVESNTPSTRKRRVSTTDNLLVSSSSKSSSRTRRGGSNAELSKKSISLFAVINSDKRVALVATVKSWLREYKRSKERGLVRILNFILESCGLEEGPLQANMIDDADVGEILTELADDEHLSGGSHAKRGAPEYPIKRSRFRVTLLDFWAKLIRECKEDVLFDEYLYEGIAEWLISLSSSNARHFRHTGTLISLQLVRSLISVAVELTTKLGNTQSQLKKLEKETKKNVDLSNKIQSLKEKLDEQHAHVMALERMMADLFKGVFTHRYRDVMAEVRSSCMESLGLWIAGYPSVFLSDSYLKYLGWMLNDKVAQVRLSTLRALCALFSTPEFTGPLSHFCARFRNRFVECTLDVDVQVAVAAIELCTEISKVGLLEEDQEEENLEGSSSAVKKLSGRSSYVQETIYRLLSANDMSLRVAAARFLLHHYFAQFADPGDLKNVPTGRKKKGKSSTSMIHPQLLALLEFVQYYSLQPDMPIYVVSALAAADGAMVRYWNAMSQALLHQSDSLGEGEQLALARLCLACIRVAVGENVCAQHTREFTRLMPTKEKVLKEQLLLTNAFGTVMPELLKQFGSDEKMVEILISMMARFDFLKAIQFQDMGDVFEKSLSVASQFVKSKPQTSIAYAVSLLYERILSTCGGALSAAESMLHTLVDALQEELVLSLFEWEQMSSSDTPTLEKGKAEAEDTDEHRIEVEERTLVWLGKLKCFYKCHKLPDLEVQDKIASFLQHLALQCEKEDTLESMMTLFPRLDALVATAIDVRMYHLIWKRQSIGDGDQEKPYDLEKVGQQVQAYGKQLEKLMSLMVATRLPRTSQHALVAVCKIALLYPAHQLVGTQLASLSLVPTASLIKSIQDYILHQSGMAGAETEKNSESLVDEQELTECAIAAGDAPLDFRALLLSVAQGVAFGVFPDEMADLLFTFYTRMGSDVDEILKQLQSKLRSRLKENEWQLILRTLTKQFEKSLPQKKEKNEEEKDSALNANEFNIFVHLAGRLARSFVQMNKFRQQMIYLLANGIAYACCDESRNIPFLDGLVKFVSRVYPTDIEQHIVEVFTKAASRLPSHAADDEHAETYASLFEFEKALVARMKKEIHVVNYVGTFEEETAHPQVQPQRLDFSDDQPQTVAPSLVDESVGTDSMIQGEGQVEMSLVDYNQSMVDPVSHS